MSDKLVESLEAGLIITIGVALGNIISEAVMFYWYW